MNETQSQPHYEGERLSLKGRSCTIRYIGPVSGKAGDWLGVEWDDSDRGKHDGTFEGTRYFACRSKSTKAASFLRPKQPWDQPRSFLAALREKYMDDFHKREADVVYISGKQAEEIGFEKFATRQSRLHGIHILVLDHMRIKPSGEALRKEEDAAVQDLCADITELDLSGNLFESFNEILHICGLMPKLRVLTLDANRFSTSDLSPDGLEFLTGAIKTLSLSRTLLFPEEVQAILSFFPHLQTLLFAGNEIHESLRFQLPASVSTLDLSDNELKSLDDLRDLSEDCPRTIILKRNSIDTVGLEGTQEFHLSIVGLDLSYNAIHDWTFFNHMGRATFPSLRHLRVTGNPLYYSLRSAEGKSLTAEDGYMLTVARLPQLEYLNYAKISEKERLNAETYYLSQIGVEISRALESEEEAVIARHPRYRELCDEYGKPNIQRSTGVKAVNLNSLAAKLVTVHLTLAPQCLPALQPRSWIIEAPRSFNTYSLLGMIGKHLNVMPLRIRLILQLDENDPKARQGTYNGPEWWDSSDEEQEEFGNGEQEWVKREVEIVPGTRPIGTYVEAMEANMRVELIE